MAMKPNYKFDKRQRDLAKKKQQEEKLQRKRARNAGSAAQPEAESPDTPEPSAETRD
ncbi:hypothetical protein [Dokdonella sp.]|uniref:hypothetical protein n=1 Tax=Dokdonella sp. TaxID=2291710 RepID=UPI00260C414A|nr:hypothetical protein [Dokdonella sp.]